MKQYLVAFALIFSLSMAFGQTMPNYLQISDMVAYPQQYGAIADNTTPSVAAANSVAILAALAAKNSVLITDTFYCDGTITLTEGQRIEGTSNGSLRSQCSGEPLLKISGNRVVIKGIPIYGAGDYDTEFLTGGAAVDLEDGIFFDTGLDCSIENCEIRLFKGCGINSADAQNSKISLSVSNCFIKFNFQKGIYLGGVNNADLRCSDINLNRDYNVYVASSSNSITGQSLELGVNPLTDTVGLALYADGNSGGGRNVFSNCHIEDEYSSVDYYVATASRLPMVVLQRNSFLENSYLKPGSGWISDAIQVGASGGVINNNISVRSTTYPVTGIKTLNINSSTQAPIITGNEITNAFLSVDDTGTNSFKHYKIPSTLEIVVPFQFDCDGTGTTSFAYQLPTYVGINRRLFTSLLHYATDSTATAFSDGDFKIGTTAGAGDIFSSVGTVPLEASKGAGQVKGLGITDGTKMPDTIFITLQQRAGQTLKFWLKIVLYN